MATPITIAPMPRAMSDIFPCMRYSAARAATTPNRTGMTKSIRLFQLRKQKAIMPHISSRDMPRVITRSLLMRLELFTLCTGAPW